MESLDEFNEVVHEPRDAFVSKTNICGFMEEYGIPDYSSLISRACGDIDWFWDELPSYLGIDFDEPYDRVRADANGPQFSEWYVNGALNIASNVVDRHTNEVGNKQAILWEGEPGEQRAYTYEELYAEANQVANFLEESSIGTGDTVGLYMPMVPEVVSILYGCFKVGAIAVPIFSGFGVDAVGTRIGDSACSVLFTGDGFYRRGNEIDLKSTADSAIDEVGEVEQLVVYDRLGTELSLTNERDKWWKDTVKESQTEYETKSLAANQESMLLYSSGTTGKPKGIVHTHAGALVQSAKEIYFGFDHKDDDRFFWVSDIGWMMGPWSLIGNHTFGGTIFMYEGAPDEPDPGRFWRMIEEHNLTVFGISPTAIRALRKQSNEWVHNHDLSSLRILGSTGEPWDPESWFWFYEHVGNEECPIINISGGTEIFGCFLIPLPIQPLKPCSLGGPGLGMDIDIVNEDGESISDTGERGYLVARDSCPSMTKSLWGGDDRYLEEYWSTWPNLWNHGDWAQRDQDGYWFLHGRADDALNVAGRKVGPAEVEGAVIDHAAVNQAAAIGVPDETTGTAVVVYVVLESGVSPSTAVKEDLKAHVGTELGKPFIPREIYFVDEFPMTQSGKIIRRAIQSLYVGEDLGDMSSIENPSALDAIRAAK